MRARCSLRPVRLALAGILSLLALSANITATRAQTPQGATLTVLSGVVAVLFANGSTIQPAPSGLTLGVGDRVATIGGPALVTFFEGSELELGPETTIILREIRASGNEVHVSVEDILGTAVGRVHAFASPNSSYRLQTPGGQTVALIRGSVSFATVLGSGGRIIGVYNCKFICEIEHDGKKLFEGIGEAAYGISSTGNVTPISLKSALDQQDPDQSNNEDDKNEDKQRDNNLGHDDDRDDDDTDGDD